MINGFGAGEVAGPEAASSLPGASSSKRRRSHLPHLAGNELSPVDFLPGILRGFTEMYDFLIAHRDALLGADGPLAVFPACVTRFIHRNTQVYAKLLDQANQPERLTEGLLRSLELEGLLKPVLAAGPLHEQALLKIVREEMGDLEKGDYPHFSLPVESVDIRLSNDERVAGYFAESGLERMRHRMERLSPKDRDPQIELIRNAFEFAQARATSASTPSFQPVPVGPETGTASVDELRAAALAIARGLGDEAIRAGDGAAWIAPQLVPDTDRFSLAPLGLSLYDGQTGVAVFLAALSNLTGDPAPGALARAALDMHLKYLFDQRYRVWLRDMSIGAGTGLGGVIYGLTLCARLLSRPELLEGASAAAAFIDQNLIAKDKKFEVIAGCAGAILGLLALHAETRDATVLARAVACGERLLAEEVAMTKSSEAYTPYATGLSHGPAGLALALLRLHAATRDDRFRDAAAALIGRENQLYQSGPQNWPSWTRDYTGTPAPEMAAWCHGAP
ncbi:MAG TPA: type 2 lanthipeptide synthetase LanM, partial [Verrucomicrobiae bacterium]|nr:type 2 lanthipeptide synthetase LanM [Verrucomicrobiae bacterium]